MGGSAAPPLGNTSFHSYPGSGKHRPCDLWSRLANSAAVDRLAVPVSVWYEFIESIADARGGDAEPIAESISLSDPTAMPHGNALDLDDGPCSADWRRDDVRRDPRKVAALQWSTRGLFMSVGQHMDSAGQLDMGWVVLGPTAPR